MDIDGTDDAALIALIAEAHAEALDVIYNRYNRLVFSVAFAIVGERSVAEEVTLDVFMRVWRGAKTYRHERAKVGTWLVAIARNHSIDVLRRRRNKLDSKSLDLNDVSLLRETDTPDPQESAEMALQREEIRNALQRLPEDQRQVIILAYFKGYTQRQIADLLAQPLGTIKTRVRLAMQKLRLLLFKDDRTAGKSVDNRKAYPIDRKK
jgi:RNA polymerase sigma-70 factor (ECF subfamily)